MPFLAMPRGDRRPRAAGAMARGGVSLLELLIVVLVLGIVAMASAPLIGSALRQSRLSRAAGDVVAALDYARSRAASSGEGMRVSFPTGGKIVIVERFVLSTNLATVPEGKTVAAAKVDAGVYRRVPHPLEKHTNAFAVIQRDDSDPYIAVATFQGSNSVEFLAMGVPSRTGRVEIASGPERWTLVVESETGRVRITQ
jgi:prepilin-type N-terminal cleavage/methylation domain-containing protein